ncbi:hypothetical protein GOP47_0003560 [Adiantum capillus-veneris]|uniref:Uncharacterized protein n=1 Tax=Adiantum capillus-veneris TaxID=13818 RepID=A0A9D4VE87_ADICA|nr:hypothetical protein GOP47_0003560 [Adiantum capillus-veneris]
MRLGSGTCIIGTRGGAGGGDMASRGSGGAGVDAVAGGGAEKLEGMVRLRGLRADGHSWEACAFSGWAQGVGDRNSGYWGTDEARAGKGDAGERSSSLAEREVKVNVEADESEWESFMQGPWEKAAGHVAARRRLHYSNCRLTHSALTYRESGSVGQAHRVQTPVRITGSQWPLLGGGGASRALSQPPRVTPHTVW